MDQIYIENALTKKKNCTKITYKIFVFIFKLEE